MYSTLQYPSQLLLDSLNNNERLEISKELLQNFKNIDVDYVNNKNKLKFKLKPQDKNTLENKISSIKMTERNLKIWWVILVIVLIYFISVLRKKYK